MREKMKFRYLSNPDYNFEKVNRASMACGPMVKWAIAQVIQDDIAVNCQKCFLTFVCPCIVSIIVNDDQQDTRAVFFSTSDSASKEVRNTQEPDLRVT